MQQTMSIFDTLLPTPEGTPTGHYIKLVEPDGSITELQAYFIGQRGSLIIDDVDWRDPVTYTRAEFEEAKAKRKAALEEAKAKQQAAFEEYKAQQEAAQAAATAKKAEAPAIEPEVIPVQ